MVIALTAAAGNRESQTTSYAPKPVPGLYVNCGYSGHGIMAGAGGSRLVVDTITGAVAPAANPFRLDRPITPREFDVL